MARDRRAGEPLCPSPRPASFMNIVGDFRSRPADAPLRWLVLATVLVAAPASAQFDPSRSSEMTTPNLPEVPPVPIFFPPNPPPLNRLVSRLASATTGLTLAPSPDLAAYVTETFYPALSTRLARRDLPDKTRQKLDDYRAARAALLEELTVELDRGGAAEPAMRRAALASLARRQTPKIADLEATAEQLRVELAKGDYDWSALRQWRLGETNTRGDSPAELGSVLRAYAFYQSGFLPAQRQLLREIVIEVTSGAEDAAVAAAQQPYLFFSPALTRVTLPDNLPADVAAVVAAFETKKSALKKELFDAVLAADHSPFAFMRASAFKALAARQAPALDEVERMADEIRAGLAELPAMGPRENRSPLPPELTQRTMEVVEARSALQKSTRAQVDALTAELPPDYPATIATAIDSTGVKIRLIPRPGSRRRLAQNDPLIVRLAGRISELSEEHRLRNDELTRSVEALRGEVARVLGPGAPPKAVDDAINGVIRYNVQRENEDGYRDYRRAVFEPGLSPEQRRLLLGGAVRKLDVPLPSGELQPTRRPDTW